MRLRFVSNVAILNEVTAMPKSRQIMNFCDMGKHYSVVKFYGVKTNPYRIYHHYNDFDDSGRLKEHKKLMEKYENLASCFYWFIQNNIGF